MPAKEPFHPKASAAKIDRQKKNGMFENPPSYPQFGGFKSSQNLASTDRPMGLEKGDLVRKGKPI